MKLAVYQSRSVRGDVEANWQRLHLAASEVAGQEGDLLVCPEMFLVDYNIDGRLVSHLAITCAEVTRRAAEIADTYEVALLFGYPERAVPSEGGVYNSTCFVTPEDNGQRLTANYRKTHLYSQAEPLLFQRGSEWTTVTHKGLKIGLLICYDVEFPEPVREHALNGCDLVVVPTALYTVQDYLTDFTVRARALENHVFLAYVNHCGWNTDEDYVYCGLSSIIGPDGRWLAKAGPDEEMLYAEIDPTDPKYIESRSELPYLEDRQPHLYSRIARDT